jgi:hypothetical protein
MRRSLAFVAVTCLGVSAAAANPTVDARYAVQTMGVDLGRAELRLDPSPGGVRTRFRFETDALLGFVEASETRMANESAATRGQVSPQKFEGVYQKEDRTREVAIAYGPKGLIDGFQLIKRGRVRIEAVPKGLARESVDPLVAFLLARAWLDQSPEGAELVLSVFDGRKRYDTTLRYLGLTQLALEHGSAPAHRVAVRYALVEALDEDSGVLKPETGSRQRELELAVSADGRYVPLRLDGSLDGLPVSAVLAADCAAPGGCPD